MVVTDWTVIQFTCRQPFVRAVVRHELGHLVGVSHVTSAGQLMFSQIQPPTAQVVAPAEPSVITVGILFRSPIEKMEVSAASTGRMLRNLGHALEFVQADVLARGTLGWAERVGSCLVR